jgi:hypothetical protein
MGFPSADFTEGFDRGIHLQERLPLYYYSCYLSNGIVVRHINQDTGKPEDVIEKKWKEIESAADFQVFLDRVSWLIEHPEREGK